jgi:uncharacterized protein YpuA (DUF1002 family)
MIYTDAMNMICEFAMRSENRNVDCTKINWDFVEADCYLEGVVKMFETEAAFAEAFNAVADDMEGIY